MTFAMLPDSYVEMSLSHASLLALLLGNLALLALFMCPNGPLWHVQTCVSNCVAPLDASLVSIRQHDRIAL